MVLAWLSNSRQRMGSKLVERTKACVVDLDPIPRSNVVSASPTRERKQDLQER